MELTEALELLGEYKIISIERPGGNMEVTIKIQELIRQTTKKDGTPYKANQDGSPRVCYKLKDGKTTYWTWNGGLVHGTNEGDSVTLQYKTGEYGNEIISIDKVKDINSDMPSTPNVQPGTSKDRLIVRQVAWKVAGEIGSYIFDEDGKEQLKELVALAHAIEDDIMR